MLLAKVLSRVLGEGQLTIIDAAGKAHRIQGAKPGPAVTMRVHDRWTGVRLLLRPRLAFGEAYMDGTLTVENGGDIYDLLDLLGRNMAALDATPFVALVLRLAAADPRLRAVQSDRQGAAATSRTTTISTASSTTSSSIATGSIPAPTSRPATSRSSRPSSTRSTTSPRSCCCSPARRCSTSARAGAAWACSSASEYGVDVTGVTLSKEQHAVSSRRALEGGLADRVRFKLLDYRQEPDRYDRIVSVGMFEHVGVAHYVEFFRKVKELLKDDGVMLLHAIGRMEPPGGTNTWLQEVHLPRRLHAGPVRGPGGDREGRAVGHRRRDPAPALRRDPAPLAPALPRQPRADQADGGLRRALLPHVGVLSRRLRGRLPLHEPDGLPDPDRPPAGRRAADPRLHRRRRARHRGAAARWRRNSAPEVFPAVPAFGRRVDRVVTAFDMVARPLALVRRLCMEPQRKRRTSRACPAPKTSGCASRRTISRPSRRCSARSWSTTPPISASPSSCGPSISPIRCTASCSTRSPRLIERGQVVSAVTLKTYVEHDEDMKAVGGAAYLAQLAVGVGRMSSTPATSAARSTTSTCAAS